MYPLHTVSPHPQEPKKKTTLGEKSVTGPPPSGKTAIFNGGKVVPVPQDQKTVAQPKPVVGASKPVSAHPAMVSSHNAKPILSGVTKHNVHPSPHSTRVMHPKETKTSGMCMFLDSKSSVFTLVEKPCDKSQTDRWWVQKETFCHMGRFIPEMRNNAAFDEMCKGMH